MSKTKLNLSLSGDFQTLSRNELKNVVGGKGSWCFSDEDCHWKTTSCGGGDPQSSHGRCNGKNWFGMGTCSYPSCPEIGPVQSLESF